VWAGRKKKRTVKERGIDSIQPKLKTDEGILDLEIGKDKDFT
jgi:hypothetical protein